MPHREHILPLLPGLRRFAVALTAPHETRASREADELVARAVQAVAREPARTDAEAWRRALYGALIRFAQARCGAPAPAAPKSAIGDDLFKLQFPHRAALLLVALEGCSYDEAAAILGVTRHVLIGRLAAARQILARQSEPPAPGQRRPAPHLRLVK